MIKLCSFEKQGSKDKEKLNDEQNTQAFKKTCLQKQEKYTNQTQNSSQGENEARYQVSGDKNTQ